MLWYQNYDPLRFWPFSTAVAALPVITLFFVLLVLKKEVWLAALCGMIVAILLAASVLMGSANSTGGVMSKMISPQSLVVAAAATNQAGKEGEMFKTIFRHSILLASLVGLLVMFYAYVLPGLIPC